MFTLLNTAPSRERGCGCEAFAAEHCFGRIQRGRGWVDAAEGRVACVLLRSASAMSTSSSHRHGQPHFVPVFEILHCLTSPVRMEIALAVVSGAP